MKKFFFLCFTELYHPGGEITQGVNKLDVNCLVRLTLIGQPVVF